jgi:hypothetical protein
MELRRNYMRKLHVDTRADAAVGVGVHIVGFVDTRIHCSGDRSYWIGRNNSDFLREKLAWEVAKNRLHARVGMLLGYRMVVDTANEHSADKAIVLVVEPIPLLRVLS